MNQGLNEKCHHHRDVVELEKQLELLRRLVVQGDFSGVNLLLDKWSVKGMYVHNLQNLSTKKDYFQIECSDLDFLATHQVKCEESVFDDYYRSHYSNVSYMTILELALHMTRGERVEERINIIRLLLEKGFLWGSGDLICKVVPKEKGYRSIVRQAFARAILHDSDAFINFPELIRLHRVLQAPLTTVDPDGWNAEMLAARALNKEHVKFLQEATVEMWHDWGSDAFNFFILGKTASEQFSSVCIFLALHVTSLAYIGAFFFICGALFDVSLSLCNMLFNRSKLDKLLSWLPVLARCRCSFLGAEMFLRVLWLLTLNAAFLNLPPEFTIVWEKHVSPFEIPSVSKWNPLPATVHSICCFCILLVLFFGLPDYAAARRAAEDEEEYPAAAVPEDRYQDPTCHLIGCICVFGLMTLLMIIYLQIVLRPMEMDPWKMGLWCGSLLVQIKITLEDALSPRAQQDLQVAFQGQGYKSLDAEESSVEDRYQAVRHVMHHWHRWACCMVTPLNTKIWCLLMFARKHRLRISRDDGAAEVQWSWLEITSRFAMSYISNGLYKAIIVYTLPLWLCRGGLTDFVLNAFATVYIVELDDLASRDEWRLLVEDIPNAKSFCSSSATEDSACDLGFCEDHHHPRPATRQVRGLMGAAGA
eukprot:s1163_g7.t1